VSLFAERESKSTASLALPLSFPALSVSIAPAVVDEKKAAVCAHCTSNKRKLERAADDVADLREQVAGQDQVSDHSCRML
jgi:hypothetical protein